MISAKRNQKKKKKRQGRRLGKCGGGNLQFNTEKASMTTSKQRLEGNEGANKLTGGKYILARGDSQGNNLKRLNEIRPALLMNTKVYVDKAKWVKNDGR